MSILKLISADSFISVNQTLIDEFGLIEATIIGLFASVDNYNRIKDPGYDGWFYVTYDKIEKKLKLSQYVAQKPIDKLVKEGVFLVKREGIPLQKFFKFNQQKLLDVLLPRNSMTRDEETGLQENEELDDKEINNSTSSDKEAPHQGAEKLGRNNNTDNNTSKNIFLSPKYRTLEQCIAHAKEKGYRINVPEFHEYYYGDPNDLPKMGMAKLMLSWAKNPRNYFEEKQSAKTAPSPEEPEEIKKIREDIKGEICRDNQNGYLDHQKFFAGKAIEKSSSGFIIKVSDERALKYQEALKEINITIQLNKNYETF